MIIEQQPETQKSQMQVSLPQTTLLSALSQVLKSTRQHSLPILSHVLLTAEGERLILSTTDLSTGIVLTLPANVEYTGAWTIPARLLYDCVKTFSTKGTVLLEASDKKLIASCGKRTFRLSGGMDAEDFPKLPVTLPEGPLTLGSSALIQAIRETQFAAATDDARPVFAGICLDVSEDHINLAASNSFSMAVATIPTPVERDRATRLLVPAPAMRLLAELLPSEQPVIITWKADYQVLFTCGPLRFITRQIEGIYPQYQGAMPTRHATSFTVTRANLSSLLEAFRPFTRDSSNMLHIAYQAKGLSFTAKSEDLGEAHEELGIPVDGNEDYIILNAQYLTDFLKAVKAPAYTFELCGPAHPAVLFPEARSDYRYVLMPIDKNK